MGNRSRFQSIFRYKRTPCWFEFHHFHHLQLDFGKCFHRRQLPFWQFSSWLHLLFVRSFSIWIRNWIQSNNIQQKQTTWQSWCRKRRQKPTKNQWIKWRNGSTIVWWRKITIWSKNCQGFRRRLPGWASFRFHHQETQQKIPKGKTTQENLHPRLFRCSDQQQQQRWFRMRPDFYTTLRNKPRKQLLCQCIFLTSFSPITIDVFPKYSTCAISVVGVVVALILFGIN